MRLEAAELSAVSLTGAATEDRTTGLQRRDVEIPIHWNGEECVRHVTATLVYEDPLPARSELGDGAVTNVWDFFLATNERESKCLLVLPLGSELEMLDDETAAPKLMELEGQTSYTGRLRLYAVQGDEALDVTSGISRDIVFTTISEDAIVAFANAFISSTFIELIDLRFQDPDGCILPDDADRGGANVLVEVLNANGTRVSSTYVNSTQTYSALRLSGLEDQTDYVLRFHPVKYANSGVTYLDYYLRIDNLIRSGAEDETRYPFRTGDSISGDLSLNRLEQLYETDNGYITELSMLTD